MRVAARELAKRARAPERSNREQARPEGSTLRVGGLAYEVSLARQLNPNTPPASDWYQGPDPKDDAILFGVFLAVCNRGQQPRRARVTSR